MASHQRRRHSDPCPNTSTSQARTISSGQTIDQLTIDLSSFSLGATTQSHGQAQPVNTSTITSAPGTSSGDNTTITPTRRILTAANTSTATTSTRNETDIPEWWPNNIPPFYIIVRDVGLGLRGEAFYWLVHGYHVSDHQWRQLTVQALEDEVDPQRRMDPVMLRRILWSSMPGNFWMHATGAPAQPGMDPARTGLYWADRRKSAFGHDATAAADTARYADPAEVDSGIGSPASRVASPASPASGAVPSRDINVEWRRRFHF